MHRNNLIEAVAKAARDCGLCFYSGYEYQINEALKQIPALWLSNLEGTKHNGINEGVRTYAVKMFIIDVPPASKAAEPEAVWLQMETKADRICSSLAEAECVKNVSDIELSASRNSITNRGEISMTVKLNIHVPYINHKN